MLDPNVTVGVGVGVGLLREMLDSSGPDSNNEDPSNAHSEPKAQASSLTGAARAEPSEERTNDTRGKESSKATAKQTIFL